MEHSFDIQIAEEYGIEEAIILKHIFYWVEKNKANEEHFYDGKYWTYNSTKAYRDLFPYINDTKIWRVLKHLETSGLIVTGNYNRLGFDRTKWYSLTEKGYSYFKMTSSILQNEKWNLQSEEAIPNIDTDINNINIKDNNISCANETQTYEEVFEQLWKLYPIKKGKGSVSVTTKKKIAKIGIEEMTRAINRFVNQMKKENRSKQYIMQGSRFFNSGYVDYLDNNYDNPEHKADLDKWFGLLIDCYPNKSNIGEAQKEYKALFDNSMSDNEWKSLAENIHRGMLIFLDENKTRDAMFIKPLNKWLASDSKFYLRKVINNVSK